MTNVWLRFCAAWYARKSRVLFRLSAWTSKPTAWLLDGAIAARARRKLIEGRLSSRSLPLSEQVYYYVVTACDEAGNPMQAPAVVPEEQLPNVINITPTR